MTYLIEDWKKLKTLKEVNMNNLLSIQEAARYLHISVSTLYRWVHRKEIEYIKLGSRVLFSEDYLKEFIKANTIETRAA